MPAPQTADAAPAAPVSPEAWAQPWEAVDDALDDVLVDPVVAPHGIAFEVPVKELVAARWALVPAPACRRAAAGPRRRRAAQAGAAGLPLSPPGEQRAARARATNQQKRCAAERASEREAQRCRRLGAQLAARLRRACELRAGRVAERSGRAAEHNKAVAARGPANRACGRDRQGAARLCALAARAAGRAEVVSLVREVALWRRAERAREHNEAVANAAQTAGAERPRALCKLSPRPRPVAPARRLALSQRGLGASWSDRLKQEGLASRVEKAVAARSLLVSERAARVAAHNRAVAGRVVKHRESLRERKEQLLARVLAKMSRPSRRERERFDLGPFVTAFMDKLIAQVLAQP